MSETPDSLLEKIKLGDRQAEQTLVDKYYNTLRLILVHRSADHELANDLTQEAFIVVLNKARKGEINDPSAIGAFIRNVGVNLLIANYRKENRHKTDTSEDIEIQVTDSAQHIQDKLNSEEVGKLVMQMVKELPTDRDRDLLLRYFVYGHEKREVCDALDLSNAHFDRVLHRARSRLKQILQHKHNVDIDNLSISHLLTISLLSLPLVAFQATEQPLVEKISDPVRGNFDTLHNVGTEQRSLGAKATQEASSMSRGVNENVN